MLYVFLWMFLGWLASIFITIFELKRGIDFEVKHLCVAVFMGALAGPLMFFGLLSYLNWDKVLIEGDKK